MSAVAADNAWQTYRLRDVVTKLVDGSHNPPPKQDQGRPMLSARNIDQGRINFDEFRYISNDSFNAEHARTRVAPGDVLLTIVGTIGRSAVVPEAAEPFALQRSVAVLSPKDGLLPKFLAYQFQSPQIQRYFEQHARGTAQKGVYLKTLGETPILVPPVTEQHAVVADLEKQFSRLDEAVANLKRVKANLKRYNAAVLKAAVEGRLVPTEAELARRSGSTYETGDALLDRALASARERFRGRGRQRDARAPDCNGMPTLPEGWAWASLDQLVENHDGMRVPVRSADREKRHGPYPYYGASGVIDSIDSFLFDGDYLLIAEDGANLLSRATAIAFRASGRFWVNNHAHVVQPRPGVLLGYLEHFLNGQDLARFVTGSAQPKLTQAAMNKITVPLPPSAEQMRIVSEVERLLSIAVAACEAIERLDERASALRARTLASAFALGKEDCA